MVRFELAVAFKAKKRATLGKRCAATRMTHGS